MKLKRPAFFLILIAVLLSHVRCSTQSQPFLSGKIRMAVGWKPMVYLIAPRSFDEIATSYSGVVVDSAKVAADGQFAFHRLPDGLPSSLYQMVVQPSDSRYNNALLDDNPLMANYIPVIIRPGMALDCTADAEAFQSSFALKNPDAENKALLALRDIRHASFKRWQEKLTAPPDEHTLMEQEAALHQFRLPLIQFAHTTESLEAALVAVRWVSVQNDYERVPELLHDQCIKWASQVQENPFVSQLCQKADTRKLPVLLHTGFPDFDLPMSTGDTLSLKNLLGKQLTILDIWASWCMPCRKENQEMLVPLQAAYREKGLQIIGYSIDSSEGAWRAAIAKDGATWPQASHLTGDETPFMEALRISTIPANFILDSKGTVVAKNLHGADLKAFVEDFLK